jgi:hypothetical protein
VPSWHKGLLQRLVGIACHCHRLGRLFRLGLGLDDSHGSAQLLIWIKVAKIGQGRMSAWADAASWTG